VVLDYVVEVVSSSSGQDRAVVLALEDGILIALADGAGGTANGALAAQAVIDAAHRPNAAADLASLLESVDEELARLGGQSTAVLIALTESAMHGASVGDSSAWLVHRNGDAIELTANQERKPLLGSGALPFSFAIQWSEGRTLLVASDGLLRYAPIARIARVITECETLRGAAKQLVDLVRLPDGSLQDDVSIVLCRGKL
jgi:serine/threonine protein phosphatase PrpC